MPEYPAGYDRKTDTTGRMPEHPTGYDRKTDTSGRMPEYPPRCVQQTVRRGVLSGSTNPSGPIPSRSPRAVASVKGADRTRPLHGAACAAACRPDTHRPAEAGGDPNHGEPSPRLPSVILESSRRRAGSCAIDRTRPGPPSSKVLARGCLCRVGGTGTAKATTVRAKGRGRMQRRSCARVKAGRRAGLQLGVPARVLHPRSSRERPGFTAAGYFVDGDLARIGIGLT